MVIKAQSPAGFAEEYIIESIWNNRFPPGTILPAERELSELIGVTRTTLREVLQRLARDGWLTIQHGKPTKVNNFWETSGLNILETLARLDHESVPQLIDNLLSVRTNISTIFIRTAFRQHPDKAQEVLATANEVADHADAFAELDYNIFRGSKIRIRATTITDFDRKEVIIPNKAFVTERLINWSLTDTTTRLVIRLGVAYGSDLEKVRKVLLKAATEHPRVMHEPMPEVFFTAFGASTLDHELRLYVRELRDRSRTVDELNRTIDQLCRENDINIAFNQLEVHLHNEKGDEVTEVKRDYKGDDPTPAVG